MFCSHACSRTIFLLPYYLAVCGILEGKAFRVLEAWYHDAVASKDARTRAILTPNPLCMTCFSISRSLRVISVFRSHKFTGTCSGVFLLPSG